MFEALRWKIWCLNFLNRSKEIIGEIQEAEKIYDNLKNEFPSLSDEMMINLLILRNLMLNNKITIDKSFEFKLDDSLGILEKAKQIAADTTQKGSIAAEEDRMLLFRIFASEYAGAGDFEKAIEWCYEALRIAEKNDNSYWIGHLYLEMSNNYWLKGEYDLQLEFIQKYKEIQEKIGNERGLGLYHHRIGVYYGQTGNWKKCFEHTQKGYDILSEDGKREELNGMLNNLGVVSFQMGEYNKALEFYEKTIEMHKKKRNQYGLHFTLGNVAVLYREKGDLDKALEIHEECSNYFRRSGLKMEYANSLYGTAFTLVRKGLLNKTLEYMKDALAIYEEIGNKAYVINILTNMISLAIDFFEKPELAREYFQELEKRAGKVEYEVSKQDILFAEATILKKSSSQRDRIKAELILDKLVVDLTTYPAQIYALFHMCDLLLFEMKMTSDEMVLDKLQKYVTLLIEKATKNNLPYFIIDGLWFKSQLSLLILNFDKARELLTQALNIAEDMGLNHQVLKITKSKEELTQQIIKLNDLEPSKPTIAQRMDTIKIENGFREIKTSEKLFSLKI
jgi:tetratricopeptide (TPR) repeat protein